MTYDFDTAAKNYEQDMVRDLEALIRVDSERDVEHATPDMPLGPGPAEGIKTALGLAERDGFTTKNVANVAGRIEFGQGDDLIGMLSHVDVVPAGEGWDTNAFEPVIKDGKIYGRGSADDKGPLVAAYYALRILRDLKVPLSKRIHLILGSDEESEWVGINRYMETEEMPKVGFSPDAEYPIINGEKGIASFKVVQKKVAASPSKVTLTSFTAGIRPNMVPVSAKATLTGTLPEDFTDTLDAFLQTNKGITAEIEIGAHETELTMRGRGAHAAMPEIGLNAATYLAAFLKSAGIDLDPAGRAYIDAIVRLLHKDTVGAPTGIEYADKKMGALSSTADIFKFAQDGEQSILINVRYPQGTDADSIRDQLETAFGPDQYDVTIDGHAQGPHYVSDSDPLVQTLLQTFTDHTGLPGHEVIIGGGTYGRILERGVAFGAQMPDAPDIMHLPNEYIKIEDVVRSASIYADALYRLAK
ncbi:dipeptidase PepV [Lacticaseibacillus pabuli]|uniref:Dipeptidase PepV n=1 Tax=Lacticaseibacillus pabuli TaxID=3025672 RepID=A0ABY7WTC1_9LACO|nr:dipeptidase PepV [Lacticaseibacillus sp. KACC 23028]WDF83418.1 dipeptidase PepV [Lacticaseibacillus sp. KACC 23028]